jgi:hypothetical protein
MLWEVQRSTLPVDCVPLGARLQQQLGHLSLRPTPLTFHLHAGDIALRATLLRKRERGYVQSRRRRPLTDISRRQGVAPPDETRRTWTAPFWLVTIMVCKALLLLRSRWWSSFPGVACPVRGHSRAASASKPEPRAPLRCDPNSPQPCGA